MGTVGCRHDNCAGEAEAAAEAAAAAEEGTTSLPVTDVTLSTQRASAPNLVTVG